MAELEIEGPSDEGKYVLSVKPPPATGVIYEAGTSRLNKTATPRPLITNLPPGTYTISAKDASGAEIAKKEDVTVQAAQPESEAPTEKPVVLFHRGFAGWAAVVALAIAAIGVATLINFATGWKLKEDPLLLATLVSVSLIGVGLLVVLSGVWMLAVELRGRLRTIDDLKALAAQEAGPEKRGVAELAKTLPSAIEQFGKLSGPASLVVAGLVPLVAAAWIAVSAVGADDPQKEEATEESTEGAPSDTPSPSPTSTDGGS